MTLMRIDMNDKGENTGMILRRFPGEKRWSPATQPELQHLYDSFKKGAMLEKEVEPGITIFYTED
jgi:hypothetical protein